MVDMFSIVSGFPRLGQVSPEAGKIFKKMSCEGLPVPTRQVYTMAIGGGAAREAREGVIFDKLVVREK